MKTAYDLVYEKLAEHNETFEDIINISLHNEDFKKLIEKENRIFFIFWTKKNIYFSCFSNHDYNITVFPL